MPHPARAFFEKFPAAGKSVKDFKHRFSEDGLVCHTLPQGGSLFHRFYKSSRPAEMFVTNLQDVYMSVLVNTSAFRQIQCF